MNVQSRFLARRGAHPRVAVMVTGGAGYIGSHAVLALLDAGWPVVVLDNLVTGHRRAVDARATFVEGDIADRELVGRTLDAHGVGAIMHLRARSWCPNRSPIH